MNKCTLLDCANTKILMYCIYLQYTPSVRYYIHSFVCRQTYMTFPSPGFNHYPFSNLKQKHKESVSSARQKRIGQVDSKLILTVGFRLEQTDTINVSPRT